MQVIIKRGSSNGKLAGKTASGNNRTKRNVWVINPADTYDTCPTTCSHLPNRLRDAAVTRGLPVANDDDHTGACYANGRVEHFAKQGGEATLSEAIDDAIANLPTNGLLRWAEVGDVLAADGTDVVAELRRFKSARPDVSLVAYTHAWASVPDAHDVLRASVENDVTEAIARGLGFIPARTAPAGTTTVEGARFVCPETTGKVNGCIECRLCDVADGSPNTVVFPAHGVAKGRI